jgi:hypothetical protein
MRREICGECDTPINDDGSCICTDLLKRGWRQCAKGQKATQWCAEAERVRGELREQIERMEKALKAVRSISYIDSMVNQNPFTLAAALAEIHYIADVVLRKENGND